MSTLTIPGVTTVHPRTVWEPPGYRMDFDFTRTPPLADPSTWDIIACHYSSAIDLPDGDLGEFDYQIAPWLARTTIDYLTNRDDGPYVRRSDGRVFPGYPTGYAWGVDWLGGAWEIRGFDYVPAATAGHNGHAYPILMITDRYDEATPLAWRTFRAIGRECRRRSRRSDFAVRPWGHGEFHAKTGIGTPTACPGEAVLGQLHAGHGDLDLDEGDDTMKYLSEPERAVDTRPQKVYQDAVNPVLGKENADVPRRPHKPGPPLKVFVGMQSQVELAVTYANATGNGWIEVTGSDKPPTTSVHNFYPGKHTDAVVAGIATSDGHVRVWMGGDDQASANIIVDVRGRL